MSLTAQFRRDLGSEGKSEKQVGDSYVVEVKYFSMVTEITAWERNENDTRGWTPRFKTYFHETEHEDHYSRGKQTYGSITSVKDLNEQLDEYGSHYDSSYDPEIPKQ